MAALGLILWAAFAVGAPPVAASLALLLGTAAATLAWSVIVDRVHLAPDTGLDWLRPRPWAETWALTRTKLIGYFATLLAVGGVYALFRHYQSPAYSVYFRLLFLASPLLLGFGPVYILFTTRVMTVPEDGLWHLGRLVSLRPAPDWRAHLAEHGRAWAIKGFFLAFLISGLPGMVAGLLAQGPGLVAADPVSLGRFLIALIFIIDVTFGTIGYALALRLFNAHIRSANPFLGAWVVALICYPPFSGVGSAGLLNHGIGGRDWSEWLSGMPVLLWLWVVLLVTLSGIYAWATVVFGPRFSNLTNRGIITHGPYAFVRHPAYLTKNIFWWLAGMPFLSTMGGAEALRACVLLLGVNLIYALRALTEERHLRLDPAYLSYVAWIDRHGLWARIRRWRRGQGPLEGLTEGG